MPVRNNGYYNNPAFAQAASNLASLFEPPSGADAAGWATADAKRAEAGRLASQFDYINDPNFNQQTFDRMGVATGTWSPNQSYYSVDLGDATTRRGQDVTAATSRSNNAADNARAIQTNKMDNLAGFYDTVAEDALRPAIPAEIATQFGAPGALPAVQGNRSPLSDSEAKAEILRRLDPSLQDDIVASDMNVEEVMTSEGPKIVSRNDALGQAPYDKPTGGLDIQFGEDGKVTGISQGGSAKITEAGGKKINYGVTAEKMLPIMDEIGDELTSLSGAASENVPLLGNYAQTEKYQQARIAGERFTQVILRNESGAATPDAEIAKYMGTFLPAPGDKPGTIKLKAYLRKVAVEALKGGMSLDERKNAIDAAIAAGVPADFGVDLGASGAPAAPAAPATGGAPAAPAADPYPEGTVISNGTQQMVRRGGKWGPM